MNFRLEDKGDYTLVYFKGVINEDFQCDDLLVRLKGNSTFDFGEVTAINSCGIREWVKFVHKLTHVELLLVNCPIPIVKQLSLISNFKGEGKVKSFYAPYFCEKCDEGFNKLLEVDRDFKDKKSIKSPSFKCETCGEEMIFDSIERVYFSFLEDD